MSKLYVCKQYDIPYERVCKIITTLEKHDAELLDKVAKKLKAKVMICANCEVIGCDTEYFKPMCGYAEEGIFAREFSEYVDEVIAEMKAEVKENE